MQLKMVLQLCDMFYVKMLLSLMDYKQKAVCVC